MWPNSRRSTLSVTHLVNYSACIVGGEIQAAVVFHIDGILQEVGVIVGTRGIASVVSASAGSDEDCALRIESKVRER